MTASITVGFLAGVAATLLMDVVNLVVARVGLLLPINHQMIGRVTGGWMRGRFAHAGRDDYEAPLQLRHDVRGAAPCPADQYSLRRLRAMTTFWMFDVPSTIWKDLASRRSRAAGYSVEKP